MRILSRYLLREFLRASAAVLAALVVTWVAADTLLHLDDLAQSAGQGFRDVVVRSFDVLGLAVPLACLTGVVWSLSRAVRSREITAIRCGGLPLRRALAPLLLASAAIALGMGFFEDRLLIPTRQALEESALRGEDGERSGPRRMLDRWWHADGTSIFSASRYDPETSKLSNVSVFRFDEQRRLSERIDAATALHLGGSAWEFRRATVRAFAPDGGLQRRKEAALRVELSLSPVDLARAARPPHVTSLNKLARSIREHRGDALELAGLQTIFHGRLAQPLAVLILVLLAIPFAIGDTERGDSLPRALLLSMAAAAGFWLLWTLALISGRSGIVPAFLPIWTVTILSLGFGAWRYRQIRE